MAAAVDFVGVFAGIDAVEENQVLLSDPGTGVVWHEDSSFVQREERKPDFGVFAPVRG